jgi:terminase large subunit-like protein
VAVPGLQCYLFRRSYPDLISNHVQGPSGLPALIGPLIEKGLAEYVTCETRCWNGSKIFLRHVHNPTDVYSYQGAEFHLLLIDELSHFSEDIYRFLRSRLRSVTEDPRWRGLLPRIICGSNPGGIGHQFVKRTWVDHGEYRIWQAPADEGGLTRQFIAGRVSDNPYLAECDPEYFKRLEGLGDPLWVRMLLDGDWSIVGGSMFGEEWRRDKHVISPFPIPSSWPQWRSLDDGYHSPACVLCERALQGQTDARDAC